MSKARTILTPATETDLSVAGKLAFWKQVLPEKTITYTTKSGKQATVDFTKDYLGKIIEHFNKGTMDQTPFQLADADNKHTMDPERYRGDVTEMRLAREGELPGLYAKLEFPNEKAATAVLENPRLGVSARIREENDGPKIIHVLGTLDPQVTGMSPWQAVDLSAYNDNVLDLSRETYTEGNAVVAKSETKSINDYTEDEIDAMSEDEIEAFLAEFAPEFADSHEDDEDEDEDEEDEDEDELEDELVGAGAKGHSLSKERDASREIELANSVAAQANSRAQEALRRMAEAEWKEYRNTMLAAGVPPHALDLAKPILNRPDDLVIDLSNTDEDDLNVAEVVRQLLDLSKGTIDTDIELGHSGSFTQGDDDPDKAMLDAWAKQF